MVYLVVVILFLGACAVYKLVKSSGVDNAAVIADMEGQIGRKPDHLLYLRSHTLSEPMRIFAVWMKEQKLYIGKYLAAFDPADFYGPDDIRTWKVESHIAVRDNRHTYKDGFALVVEVRNIDTPLIKIPCQDEKTAYRMQEIFNQTFGERQVAVQE